MAEMREVRIPIGKRSYRIQTELDEETFSRVVCIVDEVSSTIDRSNDQDSLLMLTCLQLAYNLDKVSGLLEPLDSKLSSLQNLKPRKHASDKKLQ